MVLAMVVMAMGVVMTRRVGAIMRGGVQIDAGPNWIEAPDTQQNLVGHLAVIGFDDAKTVEMFVEPSSDLLNLRGAGKVHFVQDEHVRKSDLVELEFHQRGILGVRENLVRVHDADNAVQPDPISQIRSVKVAKIPAGSATPLA